MGHLSLRRAKNCSSFFPASSQSPWIKVILSSIIYFLRHSGHLPAFSYISRIWCSEQFIPLLPRFHIDSRHWWTAHPVWADNPRASFWPNICITKLIKKTFICLCGFPDSFKMAANFFLALLVGNIVAINPSGVAWGQDSQRGVVGIDTKLYSKGLFYFCDTLWLKRIKENFFCVIQGLPEWRHICLFLCMV